MLSVADGVGGWAESGIDPANYSKGLCSFIYKLYSMAEQTGDDRYLVSPKQLLVDAVNLNNREIGSCTAVVLVLDDKSPVLSSCNLGDSGYMILRRKETAEEGETLNIEYQTKE